MKWTEIRNLFPNRFILIEATKATSVKQCRTIEEMYVVNKFDSSSEAWSCYKEHHKEHPEREFYIFHTSKETIEVVEEFFNGIRVSLMRLHMHSGQHFAPVTLTLNLKE